MTDPAVFLLTLRAVAGPANSQPDGRRYDILAFARAADEDEAWSVASAGLGQLGWIDLEPVRSAEITSPDAAPADLQPVLMRARADGCAIVVYDEP